MITLLVYVSGFVIASVFFVIITLRDIRRHKKAMRAIYWQAAEDAWCSYRQNPTQGNCQQYRDMLERYYTYVERG